MRSNVRIIVAACSSLARARVAGLAIFVLLTAVVVCSPAGAQSARNPLRPADTSSPQATLRSFIDSCNSLCDILREQEQMNQRDPDFESVVKRIVDCLDLTGLPEYSRDYYAGETAVCLKELLDRIPLPDYAEIPDADAIEAAGGPEEVPSWRIPESRIVIARVSEGARRGEYLFSPQTVQRATEFYEDAKSIPYRTGGPAVSNGFHVWYLSEPKDPRVAALVHWLPDGFQKRAGGLAIWQWVGLVLGLVTLLLVMFVIYRLGRTRGEEMRKLGPLRYSITLLFPVMAMLVPLIFKHYASHYLSLRGSPLYVTMFSANVVFLVAALVVIVSAGNRIAVIIIASPRIHPKGLDAQLIRIVSKVSSLTVAMIVFLEGGKHLGIPVTTLLASAGVGGLAVALAAQDTLRSLFGSMMILLDKPYRAGERVIVSDYDGIVEEIGLRSTKLRLLTGHMASIPNEEMARSRIENVGRRPHIRRMTDFHIPLDTPRAKVQRAAEIIREAVRDHEGMEPDFPPRVSFNDFNADSFNIRLILWYHPPAYWDFLAFCEKVNLEIFEAFEEEGIQFSLPTRVTYTTPESEPGVVQVNMAPEDQTPRGGPTPPADAAGDDT